MFAEQSRIFSTNLWRKLKMPDEKLGKGCYTEALKILPAWSDARKKRLAQQKKEGKSVHGKRANPNNSIGEKAYKKLKETWMMGGSYWSRRRTWVTKESPENIASRCILPLFSRPLCILIAISVTNVRTRRVQLRSIRTPAPKSYEFGCCLAWPNGFTQ